MYKQMFRCYAHLYWQHWLAFWDLNCYRELNTCFVHFINVARLYNLLSEKDAEPMQPLVDLWVKQGVLPKVEKPESGSVDLTSSQTAGNAAPSAPASATA
jgi:MOB kinase activator 1